MTVDSFSGNTGTTGAFYPSARFRFGELSDNDRQRLPIFLVDEATSPEARAPNCHLLSGSGGGSPTGRALARFQDHVGFESSQSLESSHEVPENATTYD